MFVSCITPGPNNLMCMANGTKYGFRKSLRFCFGVASGFTLILLIAIGCNFFIYHYIPVIIKVMTPLGALYILWLAWIIWRDKPKPKKEEKAGFHLDTTAFHTAVVLQFVNPKIYFYGIVANQNYILPSYSEKPVILAAFAVILALIALFFGLCWSAFGGILKTLFSKYAKVLNTIMALLLVYCAVRFFV
jgi:threonine/homoserine/homoserine lactone efflux protein